jgi:hypothetical protein
VVSQTVHRAITYYTPDEPSGKVVRDERLHGRGRVWTLGAYEHPTYPSPFSVRVGDAGIKVWMVVLWLKLCDDNFDELVKRYGNILEPKDVEVARWYYGEYKQEIDQKLKEEEDASFG